jgi:hypothetical protein
MSLQSLLFRREDFSGCFFREPSEREREFLSYFHAVQSLVSPDELRLLRRRGSTGREGYGLLPVLGIRVLMSPQQIVSALLLGFSPSWHILCTGAVTFWLFCIFMHTSVNFYT